MFKKIIFVFVGFVAISTLSACSEARYAAHVAKQIPLPQDKVSKSKGYFKVGSSYKIKGRRYYPKETYNHTETGTASWYGPGFHGKLTANGEIFDKNELTAAHRTLQLPSIVQVTNLNNGRSVILRVNDRGPFAHERILDVSERAASLLGFKEKGVAKIRLEVLADQSHEVANAAKSGKSTRGYEVAYNQGQKSVMPVAPKPMMKPVTLAQVGEPVLQAGAPTEFANDAPEPIHEVNPYKQPETNTQTVQTAQLPSVEAEPLQSVIKNATGESMGYVQSTGRVFVQAASFSQEANALTYSKKLSAIGPSRVYMTRVNEQPYFRVRLGPYDNSAQAQQVIASLESSGNQNAVIVTE